MGTENLLDLRDGDDRLELQAAAGDLLHLFVTLDAFGPRLMQLDREQAAQLRAALDGWLVDTEADPAIPGRPV